MRATPKFYHVWCSAKTQYASPVVQQNEWIQKIENSKVFINNYFFTFSSNSGRAEQQSGARCASLRNGLAHRANHT